MYASPLVSFCKLFRQLRSNTTQTLPTFFSLCCLLIHCVFMHIIAWLIVWMGSMVEHRPFLTTGHGRSQNQNQCRTACFCTYIFQCCFQSCDPPWPSSLRMAPSFWTADAVDLTRFLWRGLRFVHLRCLLCGTGLHCRGLHHVRSLLFL